MSHTCAEKITFNKKVHAGLEKLKEEAASTSQRSIRIISNLKRKLQPSDFADLPPNNALRQRIKRVRKSEFSEDIRMSDGKFIIPKKLGSYGDESFVKVDKFITDITRIVIFTTNSLLTILADSKIFVIDGTFSVVAKYTTQLITIMASILVGDEIHFVPVIFVLANSKSADTYKHILEEIDNLVSANGDNWQPEIAYCDFELAFISAIRNNFDDIRIQLCNFHFNQNLWR